MGETGVSPRHRCGGQFYGPRVNCEGVPRLPVRAVERVLVDPRRLPYLMVWTRDYQAVKECVRVAAYSESDGRDWTGWVELKRPDGSHNLVRTVQRPIPRSGGWQRFLVCRFCQRLKRALYGWELDQTRRHAAFTSDWSCRICAGLRFASEGGALVLRSRSPLLRSFAALLGSSPRLEPWYPLVFSSPEHAAELGLCQMAVRTKS